MLHQPTRRFGAEPDTSTKDEGGDKGRSELKTPSDIADVLYNDVGAETEEDASHYPQLPEHDQSTTDTGRGHFGGEDGHSRIFGANADAHDESSSEEFLPGPRKSRADGGCSKTKSGNEDLTSATEIVVERVDDPSTTVGKERTG